MKVYLLLFIFMSFSVIAYSQSYKKFHRKAVVVDGHNDVLSEAVVEGVDIAKHQPAIHSDLPRWKKGGLDVQFFSVWTGDRARNAGGFFRDAVQEIDSLNILVLRNEQDMVLARNFKEVKKGIRQGKLVALIGVEGGHMIENSLQKLDSLFELDMRYMTLTWNNSTSWASSAMDETGTVQPNVASKTDTSKGLNDFGRQVVKRMNELGVIVDLSHTGEKTFYDALEVTTKPVILSHSSVWNICPVFRNVKDEQIKAIARNGGVICINFYSGFISKEYDELSNFLTGPERKRIQDSLLAINTDSALMRTKWQVYYRSRMKTVQPTLAQMVDHIDYIVKLVGDDYVGLGSDYDGVSSVPKELDDVSTYPNITRELLKRNYSKKSIKKILGGNMMRVMKANFP